MGYRELCEDFGFSAADPCGIDKIIAEIHGFDLCECDEFDCEEDDS